jgi:pyruvate/2-oxoglutarate dehydrogenase complex dihydrolipoamide dehydrogenase (E3) component
MAPEKFDYIALGSGPAGRVTAFTLSGAHGKRCAVIERDTIGGACPNVACLPSKSFLHSAEAVQNAREAGLYGIGPFVNTAELKTDMAGPREVKNQMVAGMLETTLGMFKDSGAQLIKGSGKFIAPKIIRLDDGRELTADTILINTGSSARIDASTPGLVEAKPLTHVTALNLKKLPTHLIILGGGYVGLEFAQAFRRFGSQVTVIQRGPQVLPDEDADVVAELVTVLEAEGIRIVTGAAGYTISGECGSADGASIHLPNGDVVHGTHLLAAGGRKPNTAGIGLEDVGIELTPQGHVKVDAQLRTSVDGVFAGGDCAGSPHFTHISVDDFRVVYANVLGTPRPGGTDGRQVPSVLFTTPELAHVGLREKEARAAGVAYRVARLPMAAFLRTRTLGPGQTAGFAKALVEADGDKILGFTAVGPSAGEMLPVVQLAMKLGASYKEIADMIIAHPTMCESLFHLFAAIPPRK